MEITAKSLQNTSVGLKYIQDEVSAILKTFQIEIKEANKNGYTKVIVSVPTNFNIPGMTNATAQTYIYYKLIQELQKKGFVVKIYMETGLITYCVNWGISNDDLNLSEMRKVIASHRINR